VRDSYEPQKHEKRIRKYRRKGQEEKQEISRL
jgi:hypothetical protein